jgi:hypothetical protein
MYGMPQLASRGGTYYLGAPLSRRPVRRRLRRSLGAITPDQAAEQIFPLAKVGSGPGHDSQTRGYILSSAQQALTAGAGFTTAYMPGTPACGGSGGPSLLKPALTSTVGGLALKFAPQAFAAGPIVGGIVLAIGAIGEVFGAIFGHHAAAIKREQSILCAAVPAANQSLQIIDEAVQNGQASPQDAIAALDNVVTGFRQAVASIIKGSDPTSGGECNAACENLSELRAFVLVKQSLYQDLVDQQAAATAAAAANPAAAVQSTLIAPIRKALESSGLPSWVLPAAAFFVLWKLL